jgi:RimJ/RimL family protein N-acetyltransferase
MSGKLILTTERLVLNEFNADDSSFVLRLVNTPDYIKYIVDRNVKSAEDAVEYIKKDFIQSYSLHGFGSFRVSLKETGLPIGSCGLKKREYLNFPDIGYVLLPEYYGLGYAFEMAQAVLQYGISQLGLPKIHAMILSENEKSISLILKLNFQLDGDLILPMTGEKVSLYTYISKS